MKVIRVQMEAGSSDPALLLTLCLLSLALFQQPTRDAAGQNPARPTIGAIDTTGTAVIAGTLVADDTSAQAIRRATVTLKSADGAAPRSVTTDDAGRFLFRDLPAGRYNLQAAKAAWLTAVYGARRPGRPGTQLTIADGQRLTDLTLRMVHGAAIAGTVRDERGQPAVGIRIFAAPFVTRNGERVLTGLSGAGFENVSFFITTDDMGTYRLYGLPPGDVLVYAQLMPSLNPAVPPWYFRQVTPVEVARATQLVRQGGRGGSAPNMTGGAATPPPPSPLVKLATTFYPGTTDPANATVITLAAGEERTGIDLTLPLIPTVRVEGIVTDASGAPQAGVGVIVTSGGGRAATGMGLSGFMMAGTDKDGHYRIEGIGPGNYTLMGGTDKAFVHSEVTVSGQDLSVPLTLQPNLTIAGRVVFDGGPPPAVGLIRVGVRATGVMASISALSYSTTLTDGRFAFENRIVPGNYQLTFSGLPAGWYARSAVARGQETLDAPLEIGPGDDRSDWAVTFTDRPSELAGTLLDAAGRPAPDYFIVVFPADKAYWSSSRRIVQTRPNSDGTFSVKGLPTGEYLIATLTDMEPDEWRSPAFLEPLVPTTAARVKIVEGTTTTLDLRVTGGSWSRASGARRRAALQTPGAPKYVDSATRHCYLRIQARFHGSIRASRLLQWGPMGTVRRSEYAAFLAELKARIAAARLGAARAVNHELVQLYWDLGRRIVEKQATRGWGDAVVSTLSKDLRKAFPHTTGFSERNLWYMRRFFEAYSSPDFLQQAAAVLGQRRSSQFLPQPVAEMPRRGGTPTRVDLHDLGAQVRRAVAAIPWGHHRLLLDKVPDTAPRLFYLGAIPRLGWTRRVLLHQIKARAWERATAERKLHNFDLALPAALASQAEETLKSRYNLEFLGIGRSVHERELEIGLIDRLREFILALGYGFCFIGRQYRLVIGRREFFVDLLFYHRFLKSLVAVELKLGPFEPEFAGKMDFYLNLLNETERAPGDNPSVGIILCADKDDLVVEFSLKTKTNPIGVAEYQLVRSLPRALRGKLPTAHALRRVLRNE